jgi:sortase A
VTIVIKISLTPILKWAQRGLFAGAIVMLGYCGFVVVDTWMFQHRERQSLERELRLGVSTVIVEGTGEAALQRAAGHITGTGLPGQLGNIGIAGHRDTFFRPLRNIQRNDIITLTTSRGQYRYRVVSMNVVSPNDVAVLNPDGTEILTLVTCYPFYFVGSAPNRFIVRAKRVA